MRRALAPLAAATALLAFPGAGAAGSAASGAAAGAAPPASERSAAPKLRLVSSDSPGIRRLVRGAAWRFEVKCDRPCTISVRLTSKGSLVGRATTRVTDSSETAELRVRLTRRGRRIVNRERRVRFTVTATYAKS